MIDYSEKCSLNAISEISTSESFLSSLEIVINGRKDPQFIPYFRKMLSPLPEPIGNFLFYLIIYLHFHLLMLLIVLRLIVEHYIVKIDKINKFQERFQNIEDIVKKGGDIIHNSFSSLIGMNIVTPSELVLEENNLVQINKYKSLPLLPTINECENEFFQDVSSSSDINGKKRSQSVPKILVNELVNLNCKESVIMVSDIKGSPYVDVIKDQRIIESEDESLEDSNSETVESIHTSCEV
uniref:Uncharacterized protein n=1 Tax=Parastrongyloides trichosuri TaxID=131310 RepID=A0A0N4ZQT8_PARTI